MKRARQIRNNQGSMLSMTVLCVGLVLLACIVGFGFYLMLTEQKRGQGQTDRLALQIAKTLNENNRIGDINQLVVRNRELVYTSRAMLTTCDGSFLSFASPLASLLLNEAVTSNVQIDRERRNQMGLMKKRINDAVQEYNIHVGDQPLMVLPWWKSYDMQVAQINCGSIKDVQSNVLHSEIYDDLIDSDKSRKYYQPGSFLYMGNINAKLENPDNSIDFKIASLPAAVENAVAPPRLTNPEAFKFANQVVDDGKLVNQSFDQIPSAVQVLGHMDVAMRSDRGTIQIGSTAICNGAEPSLDRPLTALDGVNSNYLATGGTKSTYATSATYAIQSTSNYATSRSNQSYIPGTNNAPPSSTYGTSTSNSMYGPTSAPPGSWGGNGR